MELLEVKDIFHDLFTKEIVTETRDGDIHKELSKLKKCYHNWSMKNRVRRILQFLGRPGFQKWDLVVFD